MSPNPLRNIPSVNELLENPTLRKLVDRISPSAMVSGARAVLEEVRSEVQSAAAEKALPSVSELAERIARRLLETQGASLPPAINATGVLLGSDLAGPPLAEEAARAMADAARDYAVVELDPATGRPAERYRAVELLLKDLTGAEAALVTGTKAGVIVLASAALGAGREWIVARGHLGAVAPGCRLADLLAAGGAALREVGAVNLTCPEDYERGISERSAGIMLVEPTSYALVGLSQNVPLETLVELGRRHDLPVVHDLGWGGPLKLDEISLGNAPSAVASLGLGADLVLLAGDQLLGGPTCGIALGRRALIERMASHPLHGACPLGRLARAALETTLRLWREPEPGRRAIPLFNLLRTSVENLQNRAERLAPQLAATRAVAHAEVVARSTYVAGVPVASQELATRCVAVEPAEVGVERLASALRQGAPSVVVAAQEDRLLLDLRSVIPRQDQELVDAFGALGDLKA